MIITRYMRSYHLIIAFAFGLYHHDHCTALIPSTFSIRLT